MKSDKSFIEFFKSSDKSLKYGVILLLGISLILIGSIATFGSTKSEERRVEEMCSMIDGVGECRVMMTYREVGGEQTVYAVTILCRGAESVSVREDLTEMICSLYGVGHNRVEIFLLNDEK